MPNLESKIEAVLFFKNEPVTIGELTKWLGEKSENVRGAIANLADSYKDRGIVLVRDSDSVNLGTHPAVSDLIEGLQKEELSRDLGRAGLETLAIILYRGPISRREIDHIRGVNSGYILRTLLVRGLIERTEGIGRSYSYKATLKLLEHLGVTRREDLPEYGVTSKQIEEFIKTVPANQNGY